MADKVNNWQMDSLVNDQTGLVYLIQQFYHMVKLVFTCERHLLLKTKVKTKMHCKLWLTKHNAQNIKDQNALLLYQFLIE